MVPLASAMLESGVELGDWTSLALVAGCSSVSATGDSIPLVVASVSRSTVVDLLETLRPSNCLTFLPRTLGFVSLPMMTLTGASRGV